MWKRERKEQPIGGKHSRTRSRVPTHFHCCCSLQAIRGNEERLLDLWVPALESTAAVQLDDKRFTGPKGVGEDAWAQELWWRAAALQVPPPPPRNAKPEMKLSCPLFPPLSFPSLPLSPAPPSYSTPPFPLFSRLRLSPLP